MKYVIDKIEYKETSTGKKMARVDLMNEDGNSVVDTEVTIWEGFPNFGDLKVADRVEGDVVVKQNGQYVNKTLYAPKLATTGNIRASGAISKAQEKKAEYIEKAQESKSESIKIASTFSSAVNCAIAEYNKDPHSMDTLEELIRKWRKTLWFLWDEHTDYPPFLK